MCYAGGPYCYTVLDKRTKAAKVDYMDTPSQDNHEYAQDLQQQLDGTAKGQKKLAETIEREQNPLRRDSLKHRKDKAYKRRAKELKEAHQRADDSKNDPEYDMHGFDKDGFDKDGFDEWGYNRRGLNANGESRIISKDEYVEIVNDYSEYEMDTALDDDYAPYDPDEEHRRAQEAFRDEYGDAERMWRE